MPFIITCLLLRLYCYTSYFPISVISFAFASPYSSHRNPFTILPSDNSISPIQSGFFTCCKKCSDAHNRQFINLYRYRSALFIVIYHARFLRYGIQTIQSVMRCSIYALFVRMLLSSVSWLSNGNPFLCSPHTANGMLCVCKNRSAVPRISPS